MPEQVEKDIIKEIIAHINAVEEKTNLLKESIEETKDLVIVNKLDIINLKNETEKLKMSIPDISPDVLNKLRELEKLSGTAHEDKWKKTEEEIKKIKSAIESEETVDVNEIFSGMEKLNQKLAKLESEVKEMKTKKHKEHAIAINSLSKKVENIEKTTSRIRHCPGCGVLVSTDARFCSKCGRKL